MNTRAYELQGVSKLVQVGEQNITILENINLTIDKGDYVAIVGPSGSGKSTLMNILGCLDHPTGGTLSVLGNQISEISDDDLSALRSRSMGFVFQAFHLLPAYSSIANVALGMIYSGLPHRWERAEELLNKFGLSHRMDHSPRTLSGGEKQRVAVARALANDPPILLADEPTGALDQTNGRILMDLLDDLNNQGKTIILVTHDVHVAKRSKRIVEIVDGSIRRDMPAHEYTEWKS